ncbi:hypothetical protein MtrunA17_Chr2g0306831 [Medicago truncatula]|uniref:Transmembrane protein n=1 Tax=Medicago truncatula TaxID=3880 RepID=A0A396JCF8_MEDTR|nr:hypothetical protein MtrunA17_Chr2g0306831 [Medicago truncatula]
MTVLLNTQNALFIFYLLHFVFVFPIAIVLIVDCCLCILFQGS